MLLLCPVKYTMYCACVTDIMASAYLLFYLSCYFNIMFSTCFPQIVNISIIPIVISASSSSTNCHATLDTTSPSLALSLPVAVFNLSISTRPLIHQILVYVTTPPEHGQIVDQSLNNTKPLSQFMYVDMEQGRIHYSLFDRYARLNLDTLTLVFKLGHGTSEPVQFQICLLPLPYPELVTNNPVTAQDASEAQITQSLLKAIQTRPGHGTPMDIQYQIIQQPTYGKLINRSRSSMDPLVSFTQADINAGLIDYVNTILPDLVTNDSFRFTLANQYYNVSQHVHTTRINFEITEIKAVSQFTVLEGELHRITPEEFFFIGPQYYDSFTIFVTHQPEEGDLFINKSGHIESNPTIFDLGEITNGTLYYHHDTNEERADHDSIPFFVVAVSTQRARPVLRYSSRCLINITLVNDNPPREILNSPPYVVNQRSVPILSSENLRMTDSDFGFDHNDFKYTLENPYRFGPDQGYLYFANDSNRRIDTWYQRDMNGALRYRHDGKIQESDKMQIDVTDGKYTAHILFEIKITEIKFTRVNSEPLSLVEGSSVAVSPSNLYSTINIQGVSSHEFVYTITDPPQHGTVRRALSPHPISNFTQYDILTGAAVFYQHDGSESTDDRFDVILTVHADTSKRIPVTVKIAAVDDLPPQLDVNKPLFVIDDYGYQWLNSSFLLMTDNDTSDDEQLKYIVIKPPKSGKLHRRPVLSTSSPDNLPSGIIIDEWNQTSSFSQADVTNIDIWYRHTNASAWIDSFSFNISDMHNNAVSQTFVKDIIMLPVFLHLEITPIKVIEGGMATIPLESIQILHPYFESRNFIVSVVRVENGRIELDNREVESFTNEDLSNSRVKYVHTGDESPGAGFSFTLDAGLRRSEETTFHITVEPVNDHRPVVQSKRTLKLWAKQIVPINQSVLLSTDEDLPPNQLVYRFNFEPEQTNDGHFAHKDSPDIPIFNFTQADVNSSNIIFVDLHIYDGILNISYSVTDGKFTVQCFFAVDAKLLKLLDKQPPRTRTLKVGVGMAVNITVVQLSFDTNAEFLPSPIVFTVEPGFPQYGSLYLAGNRSHPLSRFTQDDIDNMLVEYVHEKVDVWEPRDQLRVIVSTELALRTIPLTVNVDIAFPPVLAPPLAAVGSLSLMENNRSCLNLGVLDARNFRYEAWKQSNVKVPLSSVKLAYRISLPPSFGQVFVRTENLQNFTHADVLDSVVCYMHGKGAESHNDNFTIEVMAVSDAEDNNQSATIMSSTLVTIIVNVSLYNDERPQLAPSSHLHKNFIVSFPRQITQADLKVSDADNPSSQILFSVMYGEGEAGIVWLQDGETLVSAVEFTQNDIDSGRVYLNATKPGNYQFNFTFTDGVHMSGVHTFLVSVADHSMNVTVHNISVLQTAPSKSISDAIEVNTNGSPEETTYTIIDSPQHGQVKNVSGITGTSFSQLDLTFNRVLYELTDYSTYSDAFSVNITNRLLSKTVRISVTVRADTSSIRQDVALTADKAQVLPPDMIELSHSLSRQSGPIKLQLVEDLKYGSLVVEYKMPDRTRRDTSSLSEFHYLDYRNGFVYYVWKNMPGATSGESLVETLSAKVIADKAHLPPGYLSVNFTVIVPEGIGQQPSTMATTTSTIPTSSSVPTTGTTDGGSSSNSSAEILNTLVPAVGIVVLILIATIVIIVFCLAHSGKIMTTFKSKTPGSILSFPSHRGLSPYRAPSHSTLRSPHLRGREEDNDDTSNSSSAASIEMMPYHQHRFPSAFKRHGSQSYMSTSGYSHAMSYGDAPVYDDMDDSSARVSPFPLQRIPESPVPVLLQRSALHSPTRLEHTLAFARGTHGRATSPARGNRFTAGRASGRSSPTKSTSMRDNLPNRLMRTCSRESSTTMDYESESSSHRDTPRVRNIIGLVTPASTAPSVSAESDQASSTLYRTTNPVLKDTEYWV